MDINPQRTAILEILETFLEVQMKAIKVLLGRQEHAAAPPQRDAAADVSHSSTYPSRY